MSDRLHDILRALPAERARPDFTQCTLARLDGLPGKPAQRWQALLSRRWVLATATCAALVFGLGALWLREATPSRSLHPSEARQALAEIRAEHNRLQHEIQDLSASGASLDEGVLYLGGNESVDFVVDLQRVTPAPRGVSPASYTTTTY